MTHTDHDIQRHDLRREMAGTIGLLADTQDFTAMRRYRSFVFDDHHVYLRQIMALLSSRAAEGSHTTIALFDPEEYEDYCADTGLDTDTPASRAHFTAELAARGTTVTYRGQAMSDLVPDLLGEALRQATREYATAVLESIGACASCGEDIGKASRARAHDLLVRMLDSASSGTLHLVCSVATQAGTLLAVLHVEGAGAQWRITGLQGAQAEEFTALLATGIATGAAGGVVMRTSDSDADDVVCGWRLSGWSVRPLTASEVFDAYCTDVVSGDIVSPESGVDCRESPDLGDEEPTTDHTH